MTAALAHARENGPRRPGTPGGADAPGRAGRPGRPHDRSGGPEGPGRRGIPSGRPARRLCRRRAGRVPAILAAPPLLAVVVMLGYPTVYLVAAALTRSSLGRPLQTWTGLANLRNAWADEAFTGSLVRSTVFAVAAAVLTTGLGTGVAVLLRARGARFGALGTLLLLPLVTPPVMVGVAWKLLLAPTGGALTTTLGDVVGGHPNPLGGATSALVSLIVMHVWQWTPLVVLLVFAALLGVDDELLQAAALDGAGRWRSFTAVTWPSVAPSVLSVLFLELVVGFKVFDLVVIVTSGGPGLSTVTTSFEIFRTALRGDYDVGTAAAETIVFGLLVGLVTTAVTLLRARATRSEG